MVPQITPNGDPIGGTTGFLKSLQKLTREIKPDKIVVCWDGRGGSTKRKQKDKNYKAGRSPIRLNRNFKVLNENQEKENKVWQMYRTFEYINNMPVIQMVYDEIEADDVIAYVCRNGPFKDSQKVIVSSDKDFFQVLDENTVLYRPVQKVFCNKHTITEQYGIHPKNFALARAMAGDNSDNLAGVPGVGLKTISKRFSFFKEDRDVSIGELIEFCENQETKLLVYKKILENEDTIHKNYELMQLYSPSISINSTQSIKWSIENFDYNFNKTEIEKMMLEDGINEIKWLDMFANFNRIHRDNKLD